MNRMHDAFEWLKIVEFYQVFYWIWTGLKDSHSQRPNQNMGQKLIDWNYPEKIMLGKGFCYKQYSNKL